MSLAAQTRRYFIANTVVGSAIANAMINGVFGWLAMFKLSTLPVWALPGVFIDTVLTAFGVAFGTALVVTFQARNDLFAGKVAPEDPTGNLGRLVYALPEGLLQRALVLGGACVLLFVPLPMVALGVSGVTELSASTFITFKILFSVVVGVVVTPLVSYHAMVTARGRPI